MSNTSSAETVEHTSPVAFEATIERLVNAISTAGLKVFDRIDHAALAREAGMEMPPTTVLVYGHPRGGTPVMLAAPLAALDLPLRVLVRERADGRTVIALHPVALMLRNLGVAEELAARLKPAQQILVAAVSP
ncbi:MAG: DUF302 domain-containing protein [Acetobacteraceae bacterium]